MKISVIVPVYNAEKYIDKCIQSVIRQSYTNWEMLLVDDGSTDRSPEIVDKAQSEDLRIRAIHQNNAGPGEARNRGISEATGDYVVFIDADDYIDSDYFSLLIPYAKQNDLVFIDVCQVTPSGMLISEEKMSNYMSWDKDLLLRAQATGKVNWGGVRKAVSLNLLRQNGIQYTAHSIGEEALYSFRILYAAKKIAFLKEKPVYFYVNHENSQSKLKVDDPWGGVAEALCNYLKEENLYFKYATTMNSLHVTAVVVSLDRIAQTYNGQQKRIRVNERINQFMTVYDRSAGIDMKAMSIKAKIFVPFLKYGWTVPVLAVSCIRAKMRNAFRTENVF